MNVKPTSLTAIGDVTDINCHSNLPYFFYREGERQGLFTDPVRLDVNVFTWRRKLWNLKQLLLGRGVGGYQYSPEFSSILRKQVPPPLWKGLMISFNQVFPAAEWVLEEGGDIIYYIDATLRDLTANASYDIKLPKRILHQALERERLNYRGARLVVTRSSWIIPTLTEYYEIDRNKIHHIMPGANITLPDGWHIPSFLPGAGKDRELVLGFVGKDWKRKGLPFLLDVQDELAQRGYRVIVKVMGICPEELKSREGLLFTGFINKHHAMDTFVEAISSCDVGCLFSASEALGISTLEFLRVGVPAAGFYHQGLRDTLLEGASFRFELTASVREVADEFERYINDEVLQREMKERAVAYSSEVTWEESVRRWGGLVNGHWSMGIRH